MGCYFNFLNTHLYIYHSHRKLKICVPNIVKPNEPFQNLRYMHMISSICFLPFKEGKQSMCQASFPGATRTIEIFSIWQYVLQSLHNQTQLWKWNRTSSSWTRFSKEVNTAVNFELLELFYCIQYWFCEKSASKGCRNCPRSLRVSQGIFNGQISVVVMTQFEIQ